MDTVTSDLIERLAGVVGPRGLLTAADDMAPYLKEWRGNFAGDTGVVVRPGSTAEVAEVVRLCAEARVPVVPQGGNTGLCGGAVARGEVLLSLGRMDRVRAIDPVNYTITVEAGCILADVQRAAEQAERLFPLSLGAEGTCQIGGNLSTNAGGTGVLRYGNTRDLTLGLEVVLADGRVWDGLKGLRKDNAGYDLKQLFVGGEGTLGIITAAVLKLFPLPRERHTALVALDKLDAFLTLLDRARAASADTVTAFELMPRLGLEFAFKHIEGTVDPLTAPHPWYALVEFSASEPGSGLDTALEGMLERAFEDGLIVDATIAQSEAQRAALWFLREAIVEGQRPEGGSIKNDISVPVSSVPDFIRRATAAVEELCPGVRPVAFGHVGDGNIHFNVTQPMGMERQAFVDRWWEIAGRVDEIVHELDGSFSAEHGVGLLKVGELERFKPAVEVEMMARIKAALDPHNILNPGKIVRGR